MLNIQIDAVQLRRLKDATSRAKRSFGKELAAACNAAAKKTRLEMGREIRQVLAVSKVDAEAPLKITKDASPESVAAKVVLSKTARLGMRHFAAKQDKRGVSYKIAKNGGRKRVDGAFQGPRPGVMKASWKGNAFKRSGKSRLPIVQIKGPSVFGAYVKNELTPVQLESTREELRKQIERRINLNILRAEGLVTT